MARPGQGEALAGWALWAVVALAVLVTYSWVDPAELYHVSNEGLEGGLSRAAVLLNFPIALVAIAFVLVAVAALPPACLVGRGTCDRVLCPRAADGRPGQPRRPLAERDPDRRRRPRTSH